MRCETGLLNTLQDPKPIPNTAAPTIPAMTMMEEVLQKWKAGKFAGSPSAPPSERNSRRASRTDSSDTEWEYYDETEDEEDEEDDAKLEVGQEGNGQSNSRQSEVKVNSAQEWKELSAKVQSGEIDTGSMDTEEIEGG